MDYSMGNIANDDTSDSVTIKVKVAGEDYHDLLIDWSDKNGPNKGQQVVHQLSLITGIPVKNIDWITIANPPHGYYSILNVERQGLDLERWKDQFTKENLLGRLNDGDCFAISENLKTTKDSGVFEFSIELKNRALFNEDECTSEYCHYSNNRDYLNRQIAIATNTHLHLKLNAFPGFLSMQRILKELHLRQFVNCATPYCSHGPSIQSRVQSALRFASLVMPHYSRTHG